MEENIASKLYDQLDKIEKMNGNHQLQLLWTLVIGLLADMQTAKTIIEGEKPEDNTALQFKLTVKMIKTLTDAKITDVIKK